MIIPRGVDNLLGQDKNKDYGSIVDVIANMELDDTLTLKEAILRDPTGNAGAIYRVFESELGETVGIINADYGLLEKKDLLGYGEIEIPTKYEGDEIVEEEKTIKYVLVYDQTGAIQGYITGSENF